MEADDHVDRQMEVPLRIPACDEPENLPDHRMENYRSPEYPYCHSCFRFRCELALSGSHPVGRVQAKASVPCVSSAVTPATRGETALGRTPGGPGGKRPSFADGGLAAHHPILVRDNARHALGGDARLRALRRTSKAEQVNDPVRDDDVLGQHGGPRLGIELGGEPHPARPVGGAQVLRHVGGGQGLEQVSAIRNQFVTA